jgi:hypothetical protein
MSLQQICQQALTSVEHARALFSAQPLATPEGQDLDGARDRTHAAATSMTSQTGAMARSYSTFAADAERRLGHAAITDGALRAKLAEAAHLTQTGAARLDTIAASTRALVRVASGARSPAAQRAVMTALQSQVSHAQQVVGNSRAQAAGLAGEVRALGYGTNTGGPGLAPPPPAPPPPPLPPGPNDDAWTHGGDRRLSSVASAGLKQKIVAAAILEMERNGQHTAARMLQHYLDNSGDPEALPPELVDAWLADTTNGYGDAALPPATLIQSNLAGVTSNALEQARNTGRTVTVSGNTPWTVVAGSDGDAVRTLGHYSVSTAYTVSVNPDGTYTMRYRNDLYDWYNFATTSPMPWSIAPSISNAAHDLQAAGYAQDFLVTGSGTLQTLSGTVSR